MPASPLRRILGAAVTAALALPLTALVAATPARADATGNAIAALAEKNLGAGNCTANSTGSGGNVNAGIGFAGSCNPGEFWCADFVRWAWTQSGVSSAPWMDAKVPDWRTGSPNYHPTKFDPTYNTGAPNFSSTGVPPAYSPKPGDAIVWADPYATRSAGSDYYGSHISIVTGVSSNGYLTDIAGDTGGTGSGSAFYTSSKVEENEWSGGTAGGTNGGAMNPAGIPAKNSSGKWVGGPVTGWDAWIIGYVSPGAGTPPPPPIPAPTSVTINHMPSGQLSAPVTMNVTVTPTDSAGANDKLDQLVYKIDGTPVASVGLGGGGGVNLKGGDSYSWTFDPIKGVGSSSLTTTPWPIPASLLTPGTHTMTATASNAAGHVTSNPYNFTVDSSRGTAGASVVQPDGTVSVITRDASNGHVIDSSVTAAGAINVYDLTANNGTPTTNGTPAAAVQSNGTISIITTNAADGHVVDTSVNSAINVYDLTANNSTPTTNGDASAVVQPNDTLSIFTRDGNGHVIDSSVTAAGAINVYDLTANNGTPTTNGTPAAAVQSNGTISIITTNAADGHVVDTSVNSAINVYDLTANNSTPTTNGDASAVVQPNDTLSIFTRDGNGHVIDSSVTAAGAINVYDLTANNGTPTTNGTPAAAVQSNGTISIITTNAADGHVVDTSVNSAINVYDLTANNSTPATDRNASAVVGTDQTLSIFTRDGNGHVIDTSVNSAINVYDLTANNGTPTM